MTTLRNDEPRLVGGRDGNDRRVSSALARTSERITNSELLEALGVAVYMTDAAGVITDYNEAAVALWGRRPEIGKDEWCGSWRLYWPDGTPMHHGECPMAITLKENRAVRGEGAIAERPDGSRVWFVPYPTPLRDGSGALIGAVNVLVDITDRKAAEEALRKSDVEALAAKDEFLGLISHELKTPITTILGNARVLIRTETQISDEDRRLALQDIAHESARLHAIIDDLLVLARAENDDAVTYEPIRLSRVIAECLADFRRKYPSRGFELIRDEPDAMVTADDTYVRQVMMNLLSNAIKYGSPATPVEVELERQDGATNVHVLDRGQGVHDDERGKIFESFLPFAKDVARSIGRRCGLSRLQAPRRGHGRTDVGPQPR